MFFDLFDNWKNQLSIKFANSLPKYFFMVFILAGLEVFLIGVMVFFAVTVGILFWELLLKWMLFLLGGN